MKCEAKMQVCEEGLRAKIIDVMTDGSMGKKLKRYWGRSRDSEGQKGL